MNLIFNPAALLLDDGSADFSCPNEAHCVGMMRFCATPDCSGIPATTGESGMFIFGPHFRIAQPSTVAFNGYGFGDSILERLWVDSTATSYREGIGTCAVFNANTDTGTGDFRATLIAPTCEFVAAGLVAGVFGTGSDWNSNTVLGGFLEGNPALEIGRGAGNSILGVQIAGSNSDGGVLVRLGQGATGNILTIPFVDDGLGPGNSATVVSAAASPTNTIRIAHLDGEGGRLIEGWQGAKLWQPSVEGGDTVFKVNGDLFVPRSCDRTGRIVFGARAAPAADCFSFGSPNLRDGIETLNSNPRTQSAATAWDAFFLDSAGTKTEFGRILLRPISGTPGAEVGHVELDDAEDGTLAAAFDCSGTACRAEGSLSIGGGAPINSSDRLARLDGADFRGPVSATQIRNGCSGTTAPMRRGGVIVVHAACISGDRPISLVEAQAYGDQGFLSYVEGPGVIVIRSSSALDRSTVSWVQN